MYSHVYSYGIESQFIAYTLADDTEQASGTKVLQRAMRSKHRAPLIIQGNGALEKYPPSYMLTWSLN